MIDFFIGVYVGGLDYKYWIDIYIYIILLFIEIYIINIFVNIIIMSIYFFLFIYNVI